MKNISKNKTNMKVIIVDNSVVLAAQEYVGFVNSIDVCAKIFMKKNLMIKK